jgi:ubiquitin-conjugating enzyme E2 J1
VYHGKILLPDDYPFKPPDIIFLTKNGRFEIGKKICLTISSHHAETWQPSWSIRTAVLAIIGFMPTRGDGAIASLDWPATERRKAAQHSLAFRCDQCGVHNLTALPPEDEKEVLPEAPKELAIKNKEDQERDEREKAAAAGGATTQLDDANSRKDIPSISSSSTKQRDEARLPAEAPQITQRHVPDSPIAPNITPIVQGGNQPIRQIGGFAVEDQEMLRVGPALANRSGASQYIDVFLSAVVVAIVALVLRRFFWI